MENKQKGSGNIFVIIAVIVVLAIAGWYFLGRRTTMTPSYQQINQTTQESQQTGNAATIQSDSDLMNASNDLDNTSVDGTIDPQLSQNDTDSQSL